MKNRRLRLLGLAVAFVGVVGGAILVFRPSSENGNAQTLPDKRPSLLFQGWGKPEVAIVLSGQMHGHLKPCGCSDPQHGGLARRYNFIHLLQDKGWPVVAVDLGDLGSPSSPQAMLKYTTAVKALDLMKYAALGIGEEEFRMDIVQILGSLLNNASSTPLLAANFIDDLVKPWSVAQKKGQPTVGVAGLIGPSVIKQVKKFPNLKFSQQNDVVLLKALADLGAQKAELVVLLYQGNTKEAVACAEYCAAQHKKNPALPRVNVILCLCEEETPSGMPLVDPKKAGDTLVLSVGHKGRDIGVVGAFRGKTPGAFELKYQLVSIGLEYDTPKGKEATHPVMLLLEDYAKKVKDDNYLVRYLRSTHPVQQAFAKARFVGSERCGDCHEQAYKIWKASKHSKAFEGLVNAKHPSLRQFDGECVSCHTVGFTHPTGYADPANKKNFDLKLLGVGCENCHGPGSIHASNPNNLQVRALMNPYRAGEEERNPATKPDRRKTLFERRMNQLDQFCVRCHDIDNDVHWTNEPFRAKWDQIIHMNPPPAKAANGN
jgi:hypothetical protein